MEPPGDHEISELEGVPQNVTPPGYSHVVRSWDQDTWATEILRIAL